MSRRICLLSGASGTLGRALIERHGDAFDFAAVHFRHPVHASSAEQQLIDPITPEASVDQLPCALVLQADLGRPGEADAIVSQTLSHFGAIDLLVNAAAVRHWSPLLVPGGTAVAEEIFAINVVAPLRLAVAAAQQFWRSRVSENLAMRRNVIHLSSSAGTYVYEDLGQALYAASKAALDQLTYHMASEFWDIGVRVNAIAPDTFPGRVGIESVLDALIELDGSQRTGEVISILGQDQRARGE